LGDRTDSATEGARGHGFDDGCTIVLLGEVPKDIKDVVIDPVAPVVVVT
jgi:hypothetical protein